MLFKLEKWRDDGLQRGINADENATDDLVSNERVEAKTSLQQEPANDSHGMVVRTSEQGSNTCPPGGELG
jgi:hypothetical protein